MKKNKIYVGKFDKNVGNNQKYYDIKKGNKNSTIVENYQDRNTNNELTVKEKINKLLNRNGYVFNVDVKIITFNKEYNTRVAGKVNNHLITLDNDIINISDIKDIIIID